MAGRHGSRYVRLGIGSLAMAVALSLAVPPTMASAASVRPKPGGPSSSARDVKAKHINAKPGRSGPRNPAPGAAPPQRSAPPPAAKPPRRPQRKDKPPDRSPHKYSPQHRAKPAKQSDPRKNDNRKKNQRQNANRQNTGPRLTTPNRPAAPQNVPGTNGLPGGTPQTAGVFANGWNDVLAQVLQWLFQQGQQGRPPAPATRPDQLVTCGENGCLIVLPRPANPKPLRPKVRALDNRKVAEKAEEELRKWNEATWAERQRMRQKYADAYNGPGSAIVDWCARFVTYVYAQAGIPLPDMQVDQWDKSPIGFQLVAAGAAWARANGWWRSGTTDIRPGDIVIYQGENHTGVVTRVYEDGSFDTIEGNTGGGGASQSKISKVHHSAKGNSIAGVIRPPAKRR